MLGGIFDDIDDEGDIGDNAPRLARLFRKRQYFELEDFRARFRLSREQAEWLMQRVGDRVNPQTQRSHALSVQDKTLIALRYFASGSLYSVLADSNGPSPASVNRAIISVTRAINAELFQELICFPQNMDALRLSFFGVNPGNGMPMVFGCVDGTLINIIAPSEDENQYVDRKSDHSINAMFVCGPNLRFFAASVRWPGSVHDARVFRNSAVARRLQGGWRPFPDAVLLGDSGYKAREYLLTPIGNPQNAAERRYNVAHRKTRRVIECAYGVFKNSFLCLKRLRHKDPVFCCEVIKACAVIHNLRTPDNYEGTLEERLNSFGFEMELPEEDDVADNDAADRNLDSDDDAPAPTQAEARAAAQRRLQSMVDTFRR